MQAVFQDAVERAAIELRVSLTHTRKAPLRDSLLHIISNSIDKVAAAETRKGEG